MVSNYGVKKIELEEEGNLEKAMDKKTQEEDIVEKPMLKEIKTLNSLIVQAQKGDKKALEELIKLCNPLIYKNARSFYIVNQEEEDLLQIARMSVIKAINSFDINRNINFFYYVRYVILNNFKYLIRNAEKDKIKSSLNSITESGREIIELLEDPFDIEEEVIHRAMLRELRRVLKALTSDEREFLLKYAVKHGGLSRYAEERGLKQYAVKKMKHNIFKKLREEFKH